MISISNINGKYFNDYSLFAVTFIFHLLFIFQGMDVTDAGFHLTNQVSAFSLPVDFFPFNSLYLLTDLVGGFWLYLIGEPNLLWARLGGVLLIALNAAIIFSILSNHFKREMAFSAVLISTFFITMRPGLYNIDYFSFPSLLINIEFWLLNKVLMERGKNKFNTFLLGFMVFPIVLSRIPLVAILLMPIIIIIYALIKRIDLHKYKKCAISSSLGLFCAILFFSGIYWITGILNAYLYDLYSVIATSAVGSTQYIDQSHTMLYLIKGYLVDYIIAAIGSVILFILLYALSYVRSRLGSLFAWIAALLLTFSVILIILYEALDIDVLAYALLKGVIGMIILFSLAYLSANYKTNNKLLSILIFAGVFVMVINPLGSNTGIIKSLYGMWLILPLTILCGYQLKISSKKEIFRSIFSIMNCALLSLFILSLFFHATNVYRDDINRFNLNTEFSSPSLRGIYSTPDRVKVVDEILAKIKELTNKNDKVLMGISIPMLYYLTETSPSLGNPWLGSSIKQSYFETNFKNFEGKKNYPKIFIEQKISTTDRYWPKSNTPMDEKSQNTQKYLVNIFKNKFNYTLVWENKAFAIYQQSKLDSHP